MNIGKGVLIGAFFGFLVEDPYPAINYEDELNWWIPFLELERIAAGSWLLQAISILPEHRGQGHASSVMAKAEEDDEKRYRAESIKKIMGT